MTAENPRFALLYKTVSRIYVWGVIKQNGLLFLVSWENYDSLGDSRSVSLDEAPRENSRPTLVVFP